MALCAKSKLKTAAKIRRWSRKKSELMRIIRSMKNNWQSEDTGLAVKWHETWDFCFCRVAICCNTIVELPFSFLENIEWGIEANVGCLQVSLGANPNSLMEIFMIYSETPLLIHVNNSREPSTWSWLPCICCTSWCYPLVWNFSFDVELAWSSSPSS